MTTYNDPTVPMFRRAKSVISRELPAPPAEGLPAEIIQIPSAAPAPVAAPSPAIRAARPGDVPVLDPTRLSQRRRKRSHVIRYRWAELTTGLSFVGTIAAIACLAFGDRHLGQLTAALAVALGVAAMTIAWPTRLSSRVLGYAMSATIIAAIGITVALSLPASWFDEPSPDKPESLEPVRPKRRF